MPKLLVLLTLLTTLSWFAYPCSEASAATTCVTPRKNFFIGFYQIDHETGPTPEGVSTYIKVRNGTLCNGYGANDFTTNWAMIGGEGPYAYAQTGFIRIGDYPLRWYWESSTTQNSFVRDFGANATSQVGVAHIFRSLYKTSDGRIHMYVDSHEYAKTDFDPMHNSAWGNVTDWSGVAYQGEATFTQTDVPGRGSSRVEYTGMGIQQFADDQLAPVGCVLKFQSDSSRWDATTHGTCTAFDSWTI